MIQTVTVKFADQILATSLWVFGEGCLVPAATSSSTILILCATTLLRGLLSLSPFVTHRPLEETIQRFGYSIPTEICHTALHIPQVASGPLHATLRAILLLLVVTSSTRSWFRTLVDFCSSASLSSQLLWAGSSWRIRYLAFNESRSYSRS